MPTNGESFVKDEKTGYLQPMQAGSAVVFGSESKVRFLQIMEETGNLAETCDVLGVSMTTYYNHMNLDEAFARDVAIGIRRMASKLEGTMYKNGQKPQGYMDRITWLRRWLPREWTPKTEITLQSDSSSIDSLFSALQDQGKLIDLGESK